MRRRMAEVPAPPRFRGLQALSTQKTTSMNGNTAHASNTHLTIGIDTYNRLGRDLKFDTLKRHYLQRTSQNVWKKTEVSEQIQNKLSALYSHIREITTEEQLEDEPESWLASGDGEFMEDHMAWKQPILLDMKSCFFSDAIDDGASTNPTELVLEKLPVVERVQQAQPLLKKSTNVNEPVMAPSEEDNEIFAIDAPPSIEPYFQVFLYCRDDTWNRASRRITKFFKKNWLNTVVLKVVRMNRELAKAEAIALNKKRQRLGTVLDTAAIAQINSQQ